MNDETDIRLKHDMDAHILAGGFGIFAPGCELCEEARSSDADAVAALFANLSWTHPICTEDWVQLNHKVDDEGQMLIRQPTKVVDPDNPFDPKMCAFCGRLTSAGIYMREDPAKVLFPAVKDDDAAIEPTYETYEHDETEDERQAANGNGIEEDD